MAYIMSFSATTWQIECRAKTVTRRLGWAHLRVGDLVQAVEKAQGLKKGEKVRRLQLLRIVDIREERLDTMIYDRYGYLECEKEGFRLMRPEQFVALFCRINRCLPSQLVRRIEFEYEVPLVDPPRAAGAGSVHLDEPAGSEGLGRLQAADSAAHAEHAHGGHAVGTAAVGAGEIAVAQPVHELVLPETVALEVDEARRAVPPEADLQPVAVGAGRVLVDVADLRASRLGGDGSDVGVGLADGSGGRPPALSAASWLAGGGEEQQGHGGEQAEHGHDGVDAPNLRRAPAAPSRPTMVGRPLLRYHGGKWRTAPWVISHFGPHRLYTEAFGGGASVLLRKSRAYSEVYNDLDGEVVNVFRVLRSPTMAAELKKALLLTPYARTEFVDAYVLADDPVEQARRTIVKSFMGFGSNSIHLRKPKGMRTRASTWRPTGFRASSDRSGTTPAHDWQGYADHHLDAFTDRLRGVVIENRPAVQVLLSHDRRDALHYVDPPYVGSERTMGTDAYAHEMTDAEHEELAGTLRSLSGAVVLSGYLSPLYERLYGDWKRVATESLAASQRATHVRTECLWLNAAAAAHLSQKSLFDAPAEVTA